MKSSRDIDALLSIMASLRAPETGCPWDIEQTFASIVPYTVEEAYEVADAVVRGDLTDLKDELGDLLLQVVFHAQMAAEIGAFEFGDVVEAITAKLIRRHPHVFGGIRGLNGAEVAAQWERIKAEERRVVRHENEEGRAGSILEGVPGGLPSLLRADKLTRRAATVGFDWPNPQQVMAKVDEELAEVREAAGGGDRDRIEDEIGYLLFAAANLARHYGINPENALARANGKFERRFRGIETALAGAGRSLDGAGLVEMESLWAEMKAAEKPDGFRPPRQPP